MWYIEYLRARRALTVYGLIVTAMVVLALIVRVNNHPHLTSGPIHTSIDLLAVIAGLMIAILGTVLATSLSSHVNGHLEIAWTKPIPRDRLVAQTFAIDIGALAIAYLATIVVLIAVTATYNAQLDSSLVKLGHVAAEFLFPVSLYALVQGITASVRRRSGSIAGLAWPVLLFAASIIQFPVPPFVHDTAMVLNYFNPIVLMSIHFGPRETVNTLGGAAFSAGPIVQGLVIVAIGFTLALVQWRRLEA